MSPRRRPKKKPRRALRRAQGKANQFAETEIFERLLRKRRGDGPYVLKLYITGSTPRSSAAIGNIRSLCEDYLSGHYQLEVVDIYQQPTLATGDQIIAAPTLVKELPKPVQRMVGDLGSRHRVLIGLNIQEVNPGKSSRTTWTKV